MPAITPEQTVGQLVAEKPSRSRTFEKLKIDYCCGGKKTLEEVCKKKNLDTGALIEELARLDETAQGSGELDPREASFGQLIDHILEKHHKYLRDELPRLHAMLDKVTRVHGDKDARLAKVLEEYEGLHNELIHHMMKEEHILFPCIRQLENAAEMPPFPFPSIAFPIQAMEREHDYAGGALEVIRRLTDDFTPRADACNTWRALLDGLRELELDLHQHIHKENNVLFPRALKKEAELNH